MEEMNELIHEEPMEEVSMEDVTVEFGCGTEEQPSIESQLEQEPIPGPDIPAPTLQGSDALDAEDTAASAYNENQNEQENELGSCDCRSECRYNTGHTYKYADYGYSD